MYRNLFIYCLIVLGITVIAPARVDAQSRILPPEPPQQEYFQAEVVDVIREETKREQDTTTFIQKLQLKILSGKEKNSLITIEQQGAPPDKNSPKLIEGERVVVVKTHLSNSPTYSILDRYRLDITLFIVFGFFLVVILFAGKKGLGSIIGMGISIAVILQFIVPQILQGKDPILISISGALIIMGVTLYLAHGVTYKTTIALVATLFSLLIAGTLAYLSVTLTNLSGLGSEEAGFLLQFGNTDINLQGLLLGGIIIGALGVLDDITTSQVAAIFEIAKANRSLIFTDLLTRGYTVGKEHIASLVNTLVLAYAGASLSLFILFILNPSQQPYWVILNSQMIIEEIIRTISGSIALIMAVPIATVLAAFFITRYPKKFLPKS
jgi:uncharacterized membrane protein